MPRKGSWNGKWSGEGRDYLLFKDIGKKRIAELGLDKGPKSWGYVWGDGWSARVTGRILEAGERKKKSAGFCGYDWMVSDIIAYGEIRQR